MSGHSKWSQIKHRKGIADQKKGQLFSKLSKLISIAARKGLDPDTNLDLKNAIEKARSFNMPIENIERAIKSAVEKNSSQLEELRIEAMGQGGIAFIIEAITDNRNRTIGEIKNIFKDYGVKMVQLGTLLWMFERNGLEFIPKIPIKISDGKIKEKIYKFLEELDEQEDVKGIY